jgi:hypothetical protein
MNNKCESLLECLGKEEVKTKIRQGILAYLF